jgi:hypothetical protein
MKPLEIHLPFKPDKITQRRDKATDACSKQFDDPTFTHHKGVDANIGGRDVVGNVMSEYRLFCPVEGFTVQKEGCQPQDDGNEL